MVIFLVEFVLIIAIHQIEMISFINSNKWDDLQLAVLAVISRTCIF